MLSFMKTKEGNTYMHHVKLHKPSFIILSSWFEMNPTHAQIQYFNHLQKMNNHYIQFLVPDKVGAISDLVQ